MKGAPLIHVVDDDAFVRGVIERLLLAAGYEVASHGSATEFLRGGFAHRPGCLILDVRMPGISGLDLQEELARRGVDLPVVFLTGHADVSSTVRAMKAGARDFLEKPVRGDELLAAVGEAVQRSVAERAARQGTAEIEGRLATLTTREREVMELVVHGLLNKQVAARLGMAEKTVKVHRGRVMRKMEADSLADLVRMAARVGVVPPPQG